MKYLRLGVVFVLALFAAYETFAMVIFSKALTERIEEAPVIVRAKIVKKESFWSHGDSGIKLASSADKFKELARPNVVISTRVTFKIQERMKGDVPSEHIRLQVVGGQAGERIMSIGSGHKYRIGACVIAFLKEHPDKRLSNKGIFVLTSFDGYFYLTSCDSEEAQVKQAYKGAYLHADESKSVLDEAMNLNDFRKLLETEVIHDYQ